MFHKFIDTILDIIFENTLLFCFLLLQIFSLVMFSVSYATETKTVVDKEYINGDSNTHHSYERISLENVIVGLRLHLMSTITMKLVMSTQTIKYEIERWKE